MLLKVIPDDCQAVRPQPIAVHQLLTRLHIGSQAHSHKSQVFTCCKIISPFKEARLFYLANDWQTCRSGISAEGYAVEKGCDLARHAL